MEYKIAEGKNTKQLEIEVNKLIKEGWKPFGSISITSLEVGGARFWLVVQPMVRYEK